MRQTAWVALIAAAGCGLIVAAWAPEAQAGPVTFVDITPDDVGPVAGQSAAGIPDCPDPCASGHDGGRVHNLAGVPGDRNTYFAASEVGGLFKSTDGGSSWFHLDGYLPGTAWDVAVEPGGQRVIASSFNEGRILTASVLQVSMDGGTTWTSRLPAAPAPCPAARGSQPSAFGIALRPGSSDVLVGTNCGLAVSTDAGDTWSRFDPTSAGAPSSVWDVAALAGGRSYACGDDGLLASPSGLTGTWAGLGKPAPSVGGFCSIAVSPEEPDVVFVLFANPISFGEVFAAGGGVFYQGVVAFDASGQAMGVTWTLLPNPDASIGGPKTRLPFVVANDRSTGYDVWAGIGNVVRGTCATPASPQPTTLRCTAWSDTYSDKNGNLLQNAHGDSGDLVFDPATTVDACPTLYSSDGGIYRNIRAFDQATCHDPLFRGANVGLHAFMLWDMEGAADAAGDPDAEDLYFGTQDNGLYSTLDAGTNAPTWTHGIGGDVYDFCGTASRVVGSTNGGDLMAGDRGFVNMTTVAPGGSITSSPPLDIPELVARAGPNRFMIAISSPTSSKGTPIPIGVRDTTDIVNSPFGSALGTWKSARPPCHVTVGTGPGGPQPYVLAGRCFWPDSGARLPFSGDELWTYREVSPGVSDWVSLSVPSTTGFGVVAVDPVDPQRLYASVLFNGKPRMVRSTSGGSSWTFDDELTDLMSAGGTIALLPGTSGDGIFPYLQPLMVAFDPFDPNVLVAGGAASGVFLSSDAGESWSLLTDPFTPGASGDPHLPRPLFAHFDHDKANTVRVYLGTGRGIWRADIATTDLSLTKADAPDPVVTGSDVAYTIAVANPGPNASGSVVLTDSVPSGTTFKSLAHPAGWTCSAPAVGSGGVVTCSRSDLASGATDSLTMTAKVGCEVSDGTVVTNTATLASVLPDPSLANNTATTTTTASNPAPILTCPPDTEVECTGDNGIKATDPEMVAFLAAVSTTDNCPGVAIANDAPSFLPLGPTTVTFTATDSGGAVTTCSATVTVVDTKPPEITLSLDRTVLWPPSHKLADVTATVTVFDVCDPDASFVLTSITSSEPDDGLGDGDTPGDIQGADLGAPDTSFQLRSERGGSGSGRVYTIVYTASDGSGNTAQASATVTVPHDMSGKAKGGAGFNAAGTGFLPGVQTFELVIVSVPGLDARKVDPKTAEVGNTSGVLAALRSRTSDVNRDGLADLIVTYSVPEAERLDAKSGSGNPLAFRYGVTKKGFYLVPDIRGLGVPLTTEK